MGKTTTNHNFDLDFSKFNQPPYIKRFVWAVQFFKDEVLLEKESFTKMHFDFSHAPKQNDPFKIIIKRKPNYVPPDFNLVKIYLFAMTGRLLEEWGLIGAKLLDFTKIKDVDDRSEFLLTISYDKTTYLHFASKS